MRNQGEDMQIRRVFVITAVLLTTLIGLTNLLRPLQTVSSASQATTLLYDSNLGTTPDQQNFRYLVFNPNLGTIPQASQIYSTPVTVLSTTNQLGDYAGFTVSQTVMPTLSRTTGFQLTFDLRVISETHGSNNDRAGYSLILLSDDLYGVEMAFWEDEIWVQEGNGALFTHAEGVSYDTTAALTTYKLTVISNSYQLAANDMPLLSGTLRQYTDWDPPLPLPDPYEQPNQLFLGDDTSSAGAEVWLGDITIQDEAPGYILFLPFINKP
jgi:hypothetical protein